VGMAAFMLSGISAVGSLPQGRERSGIRGPSGSNVVRLITWARG